jgi:DNA-binding CsgD family transcriptional regulator
MTEEIRSGDAVFSFDENMTVLSWNRAAEALTGHSAEEAVGRPCWEMLGGLDEGGGVFCHANCYVARLAAQGRQVAPHQLLIRTGMSRRLATVSTIAVGNGDGKPLFLHLLGNGHKKSAAKPPRTARRPTLTARQHEVLQLIAQGLRARRIAGQLKITETTVRNHIHDILAELGCHSQLEALVEARRLGLVD